MAHEPTFVVGDRVRIRNMRGIFTIKKFHIVRGEVDVWGGVYGRSMMRTVTTDRLMPARPGDGEPSPGFAAPRRKQGAR